VVAGAIALSNFAPSGNSPPWTGVEHIDRKTIEPDYLREAVDEPRDIVECVLERAAVRHVGPAKTRKIGCDDVKSIGKTRDEVTEHMADARQAMQQQQRLRVRRPRFAIENIEALDVGLPKANFLHDGPRAPVTANAAHGS
jgi:hypothetical protein